MHDYERAADLLYLRWGGGGFTGIWLCFRRGLEDRLGLVVAESIYGGL